MNKTMTIGYQNRQGRTSDLASVPKLVLANHILEKICNFQIGEKVLVEYLQDSVVITKLT